MKSIPLVSRTVCRLVVVSALLGAAPALAQGPGLFVNVQRNGPMTSLDVVLHAASGPKSGTVSGSTASFAADIIAATLEGKPGTAFVDECMDGRVRVHLVLDEASGQLPPAETGCRRRRLGGFILRRGGAILIDVARGTVADATRGPSPGPPVLGQGLGIGLGFGLFGTATGAFGGFDLSGATNSEISRRFTSTSVPYDRYNVDVNDGTSGAAFGGGVNLAFGGSRLGAVIGVLRENERNVPEQSVNGNRTFGGLQFQQLGTSIVQAWTLYVGPTVRLPLGVVVSGGPSFTFWDVELTQTAQLQAGCPAPCATVRTDNLTERSSGSDVGVQVAADYYPRGSWIGMHVMYLLTTYRDAYDPTRPLGYPRDWRDSNFFIGAIVGTQRGR